MAADCRLDNRDELASLLEIDPSDTLPDTHFLLRAYRKWDERCVDHLLGDFSFVIWNSRKKELFCARDHLGVRPFFYYKNSEMFAFGSAIQAILSLPRVPVELNEARLADFLVWAGGITQ